MNYRKILTIAAITIISSVALVALLWTINNNQTTNQPAAVSTQQTVKSRTEITYTAKAGITSLDQLRQETSELVTTSSEYGEYVDTIEGHKGGDAGKYWSFYIDGKMSEVGADSYTQKDGEVILWKFQKL